jgi:hypothetical protein
MLKDDARIKGIVNLVLRDQHGRVKQHKTIRNAVTDYGIAHIIGRMIDTGQDRRGLDINKKHIIPRMMSHMAIGVGDPAQTTANTSTVVTATQTNRFLQGEVGDRVQVMKDTSRTDDYPVFGFTVPATFTDSGGATVNAIASAGDTFFKIATSSTTSQTLRTGMKVDPNGTLNSTFSANTEIGTIVNDTATGVTTVNLVNSTTGNSEATLGTITGSTTTVEFQYIDVIDSDGHPFSSTYNPAGLLVTDYKNRIRGQVGGYYDTQTAVPDAVANAALAPFFGEFEDRPSSDFEQFGTDVDGVFQGTRVLSSIVEDSGTDTEGYRTDENDYNASATPTYPLPAGQAPDAQRGKKKMGDRVIFIATFKENNPGVSGNTLVREAGIFNSPEAHTSFDATTSYATAGLDGTDAGYNAANADGPLVDVAGGGQVNLWKAGSPRAGIIDQTMLCRTTFDVVTKAPLDTLQITWSVQLSDQT